MMHFIYSDASGCVRSLFGVFDGHSTKTASQFTSEELPGFIERRLRVLDVQEKKLRTTEAPPGAALKFANERTKLVKEALVAAFLDTDRFFLTESIVLHLINGSQPGATRGSLQRCFSGTCAIVVLIDHGVLYCANAGDCRAVLGVEVPRDEDDEEDEEIPNIMATVLSNDHNTDNERERNRIALAHPSEEDIFANGRIKGILKPTRHIGGALLKEPIARRFIRGNALSDSWNPPYTTASPEVSYRHLTPADRFVIIGSDGLWDLVGPNEAVQLVVEYETLRAEGLIPCEINVCTFIIERALRKAKVPVKQPISSAHQTSTTTPQNGTGTPTPSPSNTLTASQNPPLSLHHQPSGQTVTYDEDFPGTDLDRLSAILSLPATQRRDVYDDITVNVVYLDSSRREPSGTAMAGLANWPSPPFPSSVDRVSKLKKAVPLAKPLARLLASGTAESLLIKTYLEECWPERHLDRWTAASLTTRKFLKSLGIEPAPSNMPLGKMTAATTSSSSAPDRPSSSSHTTSNPQTNDPSGPSLLDVRIAPFGDQSPFG
jgi:pyruvate dehydrogenase phosphatase